MQTPRPVGQGVATCTEGSVGHPPSRAASPITATHRSRIVDPAFRDAVERLHRLGPRALAELLVELAADDATLLRYARLDPRTLAAIGGDRWPSFSPYRVAA